MFLLLCLKIERLRSCFSAESTAPAVSNHTAYFLFFSFYILNQYQNCIWYNHQNSLQERTAEEQQVLFWCAESGIKKAQSFTSLCAGLKNKLITNTTAVCCNVSSFPPLSARSLKSLLFKTKLRQDNIPSVFLRYFLRAQFGGLWQPGFCFVRWSETFMPRLRWIALRRRCQTLL